MQGRRAAGVRAATLVSLLAGLMAASSIAAGRGVADAPGGSPGQPAGIVIAAETAPGRLVTPGELAALPTVQVEVSVGARQAPQRRSFEGPLLWAVLGRAGAIDAGKMHDQVRQTVVVTGRDGYTAILALGEIAPEFENKQVIVAERVDGQPLGPEHLRLVVPGDRRGGRGVHDLSRVVVTRSAGPR